MIEHYFQVEIRTGSGREWNLSCPGSHPTRGRALTLRPSWSNGRTVTAEHDLNERMISALGVKGQSLVPRHQRGKRHQLGGV